MKNLDIAELTLQEGDYQTKQDLDSGYWHIPLHSDYKKYIGCHFVLSDNSVIFWVWNDLFLGLKDAVYIFTKVLVPHREYLRSMGIINNWYIDDQRILGRSFEECEGFTQIAKIALENAGWVLNLKKSSDPPTQSLVFLGLTNCSLDMKFYVPSDKSEIILQLLDDLINSNCKVPVRHLASVLGKLQACFKAFGPVVRLLTRSSYKIVSAAKSWNHHVKISSQAKVELLYLYNHWSNLNGFPMRASKSAIQINSSVCSDASDIGNFVSEISDSNVVLHKRQFSCFESKLSSTHRELLALKDFYLSEKALIYKGQNIVHYTDSHNVSVICLIGARNPSLQSIVLEIFLRWRELEMKVLVTHIPRSDPRIIFADKGSREFDLQDFSLDFDSFLTVNSFGPFQIDCFASVWNKKCEFYFSKFHEPTALGTDFFVQILPENVNLYVFPPPALIVPVIFHLFKYKAVGTLIVPMWKCSYFWNILADDGKHFNHFVTNFIVLNPEFICNPSIRSTTFKGFQKFDSLALKFDFRFCAQLKIVRSKVSLSNCVYRGCIKCSF